MIISYILMILIYKESSIIVRGNQMLVTLRGWRIKEGLWILAEGVFKSRTQTFNDQSVLTFSYTIGSG